MKSETMKEAYITASKRIIVAMLVSLLVFSSFFNVRKAYAFPPAIAAAGGAAALAAELGISTEALIGGIVAVTAAGTGMYLLQSSDYQTSAVALNDNQWGRLWDGSDLSSGYTDNWDTEYQKWKLGNGKSWEDLTENERANWDSPAQYDQSQMLGYLAGVGLLTEVSGGGGYEPSEQPDPQQDPDGAARWQKARNVLTVLGVSGGAVALNDAVGWLGDSIGGGIHDLLFGSNTFDFEPVQVMNYNGNKINWISANYSGKHGIGTGVYYSPNTWFGMLTCNSSVYGYGWRVFQTARYDSGVTSSTVVNIGANGYINVNGMFNVDYYPGHGFNDNNTAGTITEENNNAFNSKNYLNSAFIGQFKINGVQVSPLLNPELMNWDYPVIASTPTELTQSVGDNNTWNNYTTNVTTSAPEGQKKAVVVPDFSNVTNYGDFVVNKDVNNITTIPDNEALPKPTPDPGPGPGPGGDDTGNFDEDLETRVQRLLSQPFNQLFPFCLIGDLNRLVDILSGGVRGNSNQLQTQGVLNGTTYFELDTSGFGVVGLDNIHVDLEPLHDFALSVRGMFTALFITALIIGTFRFFLVRGGE